MNEATDKRIVRKSFVLLIIRILLSELLFEAIIVFLLLGIELVPFPFENKEILRFMSIIFIVVATLFQLVILAMTLLKWSNEFYEFDREEFTLWTGIISKQGKSYPYSNIQAATVKQSFFGRIFKYGTVSFYVPVLGHELTFNEVPKPFEFVEQIKNKLSEEEKGKFLIRRR